MKSRVFNPHRRHRRHRHFLCTEDGTGVVGTMFGALVFLSFVALATHTALGLYATSVVKAVAWDEAARVAADPAVIDDADADLHRRLSGMTLMNRSWKLDDPDVVELDVRVLRPNVLPASLAKRTLLTTIEQRVVVRREQPR